MHFKFLANLLFPQICVICRQPVSRGAACRRCLDSIPLRDGFFCGKCRARLPCNAKTQGQPNHWCHPELAYAAGAAGNYHDPSLRSLIHHLKFRFIKDAAEPLAQLLVRFVARSNFDPTGFAVIPIPLSRRRMTARGFNQSELIARHFASRIGLVMNTTSLTRARHAKPQSGLSEKEERAENIQGSFMVNNFISAPTDSLLEANIHKPLLYKNIILLDDVTTSGSTFLAATLALKAAGAEKIIALAVAKA